MIFRYYNSVFVQTRSKRGMLNNFELRVGRWNDNSKPLGYHNCPKDHYIVAPYELMEWKDV